jgi:hypothetical protein
MFYYLSQIKMSDPFNPIWVGLSGSDGTAWAMNNSRCVCVWKIRFK